MRLSLRVAAALPVIGLLVSAVPSAEAGDKVKLTSLNWPPYNGAQLEHGGANTAKLKALLMEAGYSLDTTFLPWKRAVAYGLEKDDYLGYFPEYYREDKGCLWSKQFDASVVGFVEQAEDNLDWSEVADLESYRIGVVDGYANDNGPFDAAMKAGELNIDAATDDITNVKKVAHGRLDAAVIDKKVLQHVLKTELSDLAGEVRFDQRPLAENGLFVCFQPDHPKARDVRDALNAVISDAREGDPAS